MKLSELASLTGARLDGMSADLDITGAAGLDDAVPGQVSFLANPRYTPKVNTTRASAVYLSEDAPIERQIAILRAKDPYLAYTRALRLFNPEPVVEPTIHQSAVIHPSAQIGRDVGSQTASKSFLTSPSTKT
jgi:UDP-3-O-[3-hydroxymyristoyl] glucosamine N-acyltransferase